MSLADIFSIYTTIKITTEFRTVSVTMGVVDGLALHGLHGAARKADLTVKCGIDWGL